MISTVSVFVSLLLVHDRHVLCDREHKVHNIVLYPDRHSWCQTTPIKQIVSMPGYEPMTIDNNVCVGACYSYSIPRTQPAEPGELIGPYCDSCQPSKTQCYHVTLQADPKQTEGPKSIQKQVQIITNCSCSTCSKEQTKDCEIYDHNTLELPMNLFSLLYMHENKSSTKPESETPELINVTSIRDQPELSILLSENITNEQPYEINSKLIALLKSIQNQEDDDDSNLNYDKDQLRELLDIIEGSEHQLSDKNLMEFVNFINVHNSEDLELDLSRLKEVLESFRNEQELMEKHRDFGIGINLDHLGSRNNENVNRDLESLGKKYHIPKNFGIEGNHLGLSYHKGSHIGMGIGANMLDTQSKHEDDIKNHKLEGTKGHHHIGEVQHLGLRNGHLVHGPRDSLVVVPDNIKVEEKLNLDSDEMQENHEGTVISYENHHTIHHAHHKLQTNTDF